MAHISMSRAVFLMVFIMGLMLASRVRAEGSEFVGAPAPAPTMDAGDGFAVTHSAAFVCSSLLFSLVALLLH